MNPLFKVWEDRTPHKLKNTNWTLTGFSIAGYRTNFYINELDLMLDAGISANYHMKNILITHNHSDHIASLPFHLYNTTNNNKINIFCPNQAKDYLIDFIDSMFKASYQTPILYDNKPYTIKGLNPDEEFLITDKDKLVIKTFQMDHSIDSIGYGISHVRKRLDPKYSNLSGKEIGQLSKSGVPVNEEYLLHQIIFCGDTYISSFQNEEIFKYKTIIVECTFILDDDIHHAIAKKHIHWLHLEPYIKAHPDNDFILIHFSPRYKQTDIKEFFDKVNFPNIILWTHTN
jgi:ribonuclease Z